MEPAEQIYRQLIEPIEGRMIRIVSRIVRDPDDSCDVFQEVIAVIWAKLARIDRHPKPHAYMLRICVSRAYDFLRKRARRRRFERPMETAAPPARMDANSERLERDDQSAALRRALASLPSSQAQAVLLRAMDGATYEAIGDILGCSAATARSHFSKGRARLGHLIQE